MDEEMMHKRIDLVIIPWRNKMSTDILPILILDAHHVHMMGTVVNRIPHSSRLHIFVSTN